MRTKPVDPKLFKLVNPYLFELRKDPRQLSSIFWEKNSWLRL